MCFEEQFTLFNKGRLPMPWIEVFNQSTLPFAAGSRLFTLVLGRQRRNYLARTWLTRRGGFPLGPTRLTTGDPFGLFTAGKTVPADETWSSSQPSRRFRRFHFRLACCPVDRSCSANRTTSRLMLRVCANMFMVMR
jgi:hypothetical protein